MFNLMDERDYTRIKLVRHPIPQTDAFFTVYANEDTGMILATVYGQNAKLGPDPNKEDHRVFLTEEKANRYVHDWLLSNARSSKPVVFSQEIGVPISSCGHIHNEDRDKIPEGSQVQ